MGDLIPQGLKPTLIWGSFDVRAEARTLQLKPVPFKLTQYQKSGQEGPAHLHLFRELRLPAPSGIGDLQLKY